MWGACQVHWSTWARLLRAHGVAYEPEDLLDLEAGLDAGAAVLLFLRIDRQRNLPLTLCIYSAGTPALSYTKDCPYSNAVERNLQRAHRALWTTRTP